MISEISPLGILLRASSEVVSAAGDRGIARTASTARRPPDVATYGHRGAGCGEE